MIATPFAMLIAMLIASLIASPFATPIATPFATPFAAPIATPIATPIAMPIATFPVGTPYMVSALLALGVFDEAHDMAVHSVMMTANHAVYIRYTFTTVISLEGRNGQDRSI
ncbi:MAG: hypothetical protein RSC40_09260 [Clostridia bacterium]